jgi:hypothetical protein
MKRLIQLALLLAPLAGCAHLAGGGSSARDRADLWSAAQVALAEQEYVRAEAVFTQLSTRFPDSLEGRESLFYLGALHLDPRNPGWDAGPAQDRLEQYLAGMETATAPRLYRYPEAQILHEIARQLNLPPAERVAALQPGERVVEERVLVPAQQSRELADEVVRLRQLLAERDARVAQQQEELERIRRTLTAPARP